MKFVRNLFRSKKDEKNSPNNCKLENVSFFMFFNSRVPAQISNWRKVEWLIRSRVVREWITDHRFPSEMDWNLWILRFLGQTPGPGAIPREIVRNLESRSAFQDNLASEIQSCPRICFFIENYDISWSKIFRLINGIHRSILLTHPQFCLDDSMMIWIYWIHRQLITPMFDHPHVARFDLVLVE